MDQPSSQDPSQVGRGGPSEPAPGTLLAGKYRVERTLGSGGMGVVVAARHVQLDELVALKFLHAHIGAQKEYVERFLREGRAAVKIKSEHVARVADVGTLENGAPFMVMEYLEGCDLSELLRDHGRLPTDAALRYVMQACDAIAEAHAAGIVHRDLKPANLFLTEKNDGSPCVKVLDFGISKLRDDAAGGHLTSTNGVMGSPLYMSPEQINRPRDVDARTDIYALGVILFELLSDDRPFNADSLMHLVSQIATERPALLRSVVPSAPAALEAVIDKCLSKNADDRYGSIAELARALEPLLPEDARPLVERIARVAVARTKTGRTLRTDAARTPHNPTSPDGSLDPATDSGNQRDRVAPLGGDTPTIVKTDPDGSGALPAARKAVAAAASSGLASAGFAPGSSSTSTPGSVAAQGAGQGDARTTTAGSARASAVATESTSRARVVVLGAIVAVAAIGAIVFGATRSGTAPAATVDSSTATSARLPAIAAPIAAPTTAPTTPLVVAATTETNAASASATAAPAVAAPTSIAPHAATMTAPAASQHKTAPAASASAPSANCSPPYTIDAEGKKHYKLECL